MISQETDHVSGVTYLYFQKEKFLWETPKVKASNLNSKLKTYQKAPL